MGEIIHAYIGTCMTWAYYFKTCDDDDDGGGAGFARADTKEAHKENRLSVLFPVMLLW